MAKSIKLDALSSEIMNLMREYAGETAEDVKSEIDKVAKDTVNEVKKKAPVRKDVGERKYKSGKSYKPGSYRKSWTSRTVEESALKKVRVVYAGQYQLTHLLEKGHAKRGGGRVSGIPHIAPAEQMAIKELENGLKARLTR